MDNNKERVIGKVLVALCVIALLLSGWMLVHSLVSRPMPGCGADSGCGSVMSGKWAYIGGLMPVSALAVGTYLAMLACLWGIGNAENAVSLAARRCMLLLGGAIFASAIWFTALQLLVIHSICRYCMSVHILGIAVTVLTFMLCGRSVRRWMLIAAGVGLGAVMAIVQTVTLPDAVYDEGSTQEPLPLFTSDEYPVVGPADAPVKVELMFDYQCSHCRKLHTMLPQLADMFGGRVAFITLPVPLSNACNYYLPEGPDMFEGSCTLARLALAVWQKAPERFREFDGWLFEEGPDGWYPRTVDDATAMAEQLAGHEALASAIGNEWTESYFRKVFELFGRTSEGRGGGIPRFVYGQRWLVPDADTPDALYGLIGNLINTNDNEKN